MSNEDSPTRPYGIFTMPIYEKTYGNHKEFKEKVSNFLFDEKNYIENTTRETLKFTHPNLHKMSEFAPFIAFLKRGVSDAMEDLGYYPNFNLTGVWATRHIGGGYHHRHIHKNSFLGGVYYFNGINGITPGTTFYSDWKQPLIEPAIKSPGKLKINYTKNMTFEEGKLIIFPAWLEHSTPFNVENSDRIILSFNCMPVGKTNQDPFDRYNYQNIENVEMISYMKEKYKV